VHDYQLALVPRMVRRRIPDATIGFFLHIPFPASEVLRILPWREQVLDGMLGADLVAFQTFTYRSHFSSAVLRILGLPTQGDGIHVDGRQTRLGVFPIGVDAGPSVSSQGGPKSGPRSKGSGPMRAANGSSSVLIGSTTRRGFRGGSSRSNAF